jgi:hypothetical protein
MPLDLGTRPHRKRRLTMPVNHQGSSLLDLREKLVKTKVEVLESDIPRLLLESKA